MIVSPDDTTPHQLVVIYSSQPGRLGQSYALAGGAALTVGRGTQNSIVLDGDSVSRRHARFEPRGGEWWVVDLGSTNGTYVNSQQVPSARLSVGDHVKVGATIFKVDSPVSAADRIDEGWPHVVTWVDGLTGSYNRRFFLEGLDRELARWARDPARPLSLVMIDLDHFKRLNDCHGHLAGDQLLQQFAASVQIYAAPGGLVARHGGEEFALLLPGLDGAEAAARAELLRAEVAGRAFRLDAGEVSVTLSAGVAQAGDGARTARALIERADERLYEAKRAGRNRVVA